MLKNISGLGTILSKTEQSSINGGDERITCTFSDGTGYELTYDNSHDAFLSLNYCFESGGTGTVTTVPSSKGFSPA
jgi:hypothetical protein